MEPVDEQDDLIEAEAADWVVRLGAPGAGTADRDALDEWLRRSPRHADAFAFASAAWGQMVHVDRARVIAGRARRPSWRAMTASVLLVVGAGLVWLGNPLIALRADHRTAPAERATVTLADGSQVELGPDSAIALYFTETERRVELLSGTAYFTAAPMAGGEGRPFIVEGGGGSTRALGTQFEVEHLAGGIVDVVVAEHQVRVEAGGAGLVVAPGQAVRYSPDGIGPVTARNVDQATAWRRGRLIFDRVPLAAVVDELNRYRRGRIVIADDALGQMEVSGMFEAAELDGALEQITHSLGVGRVAVPLVTILY